MDDMDMKETEKVPSRPTRYDLNALLNAVKDTVDANPYATPVMFRAGAEGVIRGYLRGKGSKVNTEAIGKLIRFITGYAIKREDESSKWWSTWRAKNSEVRESKRSENGSLGGRFWRALPAFLRPTTYEVSSDVRLIATGDGQQVMLLGERGLMAMLDTPHDARQLALGLMDAVTRLEDDHSVVQADPIPDTAAELAIIEWEDRIRWGITGDCEDES